jgi:hypothetical protein
MAGARGRLVVDSLRVGGRPVTIGSTVLGLAAHGSGAYRVGVRVPRSLPVGSYALIACVARGRSGALACATAERHIQIGRGAPVAHTTASTSSLRGRCSSGAHSLSPYGSRLYPETGNGGYTSIHTSVFLNYDANQNLLLPGTRVVLIDQATQCLTDFSLDFERSSPNTDEAPDMSVESVFVNGSRRALSSCSRRTLAIPTVRTTPTRGRTRPRSRTRWEDPRTIRYLPPARRRTAAPSNPRPYTLFAGTTTYTRPGIAYIALRRILGPSNFAAALRHMQATYRQGNITEPQITAPGLDGGGFKCDP